MIDFIRRINNCGFEDACRSIARLTGIRIADPDRSATSENLPRRILSIARDFYRNRIRKKGCPGMEYMLERDFSPDVLEKFRIGFAPNSWDALYLHLRGMGINHEEILSTGLCRKSRNTDNPYDFFRNRVTFPISTRGGFLAGFGARVIDGSLPKYLNTSESPIFKKSGILYGMDESHRHIRSEKTAFVFEGYTDFLRAWQHDIKNAVATLGTAFTAGHAQQLAGTAETVILVFDSDTAGLNAARKAIPMMHRYPFRTKFMILPENRDPDQFIHSEGKSGFMSLSGQALHFIAFMLESEWKTIRSRKDTDPSSVSGMVLSLVGALVDSGMSEITLSENVRYISDRTGIDYKPLFPKIVTMSKG